jgi:hypothetical protein
VLHIPVTEIRLQAADVGSAVDQTLPTGVAQHMRMRPEGEFRLGAGAIYQGGETDRGERATAFRHERENPSAPAFPFSACGEPGARRPGYSMNARSPAFHTSDVNLSLDETELGPSQITYFCCSKAVPVANQDHRGVTVPPPVLIRLALREKANPYARKEKR